MGTYGKKTKMKKLRIIGMALLTVVLCLGISSCSNDDEENVIGNIVGKWKTEWVYEDGDPYPAGTTGYCIYTFNPNGTGHYFEFDHGEVERDRDIYYFYDNEKLLLGAQSGGKEAAEQWAKPIKWINGNTIEWDGDIWKRQ